MSKELDYTHNPKVTYMRWGVTYVLFFALLIAVFLLVAGRIHTYSTPKGSFELSIPYAKYLVGETVTFTLKNNFNSPVYVADDCPSEPLAVYKFENTTWVRMHDGGSDESCEAKDRQIVIPAGGERTGSFADWKNLFASPGKYRIVAYVEYFDAMPYQDFEVIAQPTPVATTPVKTQMSTVPTATTPTVTPTPVAQSKRTENESDD